ncbi:MAG: hypothetical protein Q9219_000937 [cf. Caloplaca sp. 3 TL-2023]
MSRRAPNPAAERAAQNQQTIKTLLKLEANKSCADCKRNKPSKIENFIRTKYESKRWVMDGPMPDPSTLDAEGDDDIPLNVVQEKAKMERSSSQKLPPNTAQPARPIPKPAPDVDLFGDIPTPPARPSTTDTPSTRPPPPKVAAPPKQPKQGDSLLGLDFFGTPSSTSSAKPSGASSTPGSIAAPSRPDLKQSILSLYSSAPRTQSQPQQDSQDLFGGMQSPTTQPSSTSGGFDDAFSSLSFASATSPPAAQAQPTTKHDPFASFSKPSTQRTNFSSPSITSPPLTSGGGFFDTGTKPAPKSAKPPAPATQPLRTPAASNGLGDFSFISNTVPVAKPPPSNISNNLFDFSDPMPSQPIVTSKPPPPPSSNPNSAFNLSKPASVSQPVAKSTPVAPVSSTAFAGFSNDDPWGSSNAWATPDPSTTTKPKTESKSPAIATTSDFSSWGQSNSVGGSGVKPTPQITADEDFGGWNSAAPVTPAAANPPAPSSTKPSGGFAASEDLFSNVWE